MTASTDMNYLPADLDRALLIGRVWRATGGHEGPSVVAVRNGEVFDITSSAPTTADLFERDDAVDVARNAPGEHLGSAAQLVAASLANDAAANVRLLAPCDVQPIKACGVTFAVSLIERVIEEQAGGDPAKAEEVRETIATVIGTDLSKVKPGSEAAARLKAELERRGAWSQYMEGRHRPRCRGVFEVAGDVVGGVRRRCRFARGLDMEQSGAGNRAGREQPRDDRGRDAR